MEGKNLYDSHANMKTLKCQENYKRHNQLNHSHTPTLS